MSQQRQIPIMGGGSCGGGVGGNYQGQYIVDTTFTKIFVGGLAWKTQRDTMQRYFEQFGEILEAVVITDKNSGKSKGYGFVTFREPEAAIRACENPSPVIDGRRANCNLAYLGAVHKPRLPTPTQGIGRFLRAEAEGFMASPAHCFHGSSTSYTHQPTDQYTFPYSVHGYGGGHSQDNMYFLNYYSGYGGQHFSPYYASGATGPPAAGVINSYYPFYSQYAQGSSSQTPGFGVQYPLMLQYSYIPHQQYGGFMGNLPLPSLAPPSLPTAVGTTTTTTTTTTTGATISVSTTEVAASAKSRQ